MSDEAMKLLDDLDWAEKVVKRKSVEAAEAQNALGEAMDERAQASRRVAAMIRANHSSSISFGGNVYALRQGDVVERIPMVIAQDCKVPEEGLDAGEFILRWWGRVSQRFGYLGRGEDGDEAIVHDKTTAFRFSSIAQAEQFRTDRELTLWEVARFDDPVGPPIDAEVEDDITPESLARALKPSDEEIDEAAGYAAAQDAFSEAAS